MQAHEMIATHPDVRGNTNDALIRCIEQCYSCAQVCTSCADACLAEDNIHNLAELSRAAQALMRRSSAGCWTYAPQLAACVARSVCVMPPTMSTAGSVLRRVDVAWQRASRRQVRSTNQRRYIAGPSQRPFNANAFRAVRSVSPLLRLAKDAPRSCSAEMLLQSGRCQPATLPRSLSMHRPTTLAVRRSRRGRTHGYTSL
jgi:hypothetical protein